MLDRAFSVVAAFALAVAILLFVPYQVLVITLTVVACAASGYFTLTWGFAIVRARVRSKAKVSTLGMIDFAGLPAMVFLYTVMALVEIIQKGGVPEATDIPTYIRRVVLYLLLTVIAVMRAVRWVRFQRAADGEPVVLVPVGSASSEHHDALEGRGHERDPERGQPRADR